MVISKGSIFQINDQFDLHIATEHKKEFKEILEFNCGIHEESVGEYLTQIYYHHPKGDDIFWLYIKDVNSDQIVSSLALLPLEWRMDSLQIPVCEMGFVGTAEPYRKRGLMKELNSVYEQIMAEQGYLLSAIRGIPYFYRTLGYEFSFPLDDRFLLPKAKIPIEKSDSILIKNATLKDLEYIRGEYENYHQNVLFWNSFWKESFAFKYLSPEISDFKGKTYIIQEDGKKVAFFTLGMSYDWKGYKIRNSTLARDHAVKLLQFLKNFQDDEKTEIDFDLHPNSVLSNLILELGGYQYMNYGWQVKIPDVARFLCRIKELLENRIKNSEFQNLSKTISLSNYHQTFKIHFEEGKITEIQTVKEFPGELVCDVQIPGTFLYKLLLGDKSFEEINYIIKDAMIEYSSRNLISILFPKRASFPETYY